MANTIECTVCNHSYKPVDILMPEACPACSTSRQYVRLPCVTCPEVQLESAMQTSGYAALLHRAADLYWLLERPGGSVSLDDLDYDEFVCVKLLKLEADRYNEERQKQAERGMLLNQRSSGKGSRGRERVNQSNQPRQIESGR